MSGAEVVAVLAVVGLIVSNALWLRSMRFLVNTAVSRSPLELAQRQQITEEKRPPAPKPEKRPRPEGL